MLIASGSTACKNEMVSLCCCGKVDLQLILLEISFWNKRKNKRRKEKSKGKLTERNIVDLLPRSRTDPSSQAFFILSQIISCKPAALSPQTNLFPFIIVITFFGEMSPFQVDGMFIAACALVSDLRPASSPNVSLSL